MGGNENVSNGGVTSLMIRREDEKLTARKAVSFHTALSSTRLALFPTNMGDVGIASIKFWSNNTLLLPEESGLYRDLDEPLRS